MVDSASGSRRKHFTIFPLLSRLLTVALLRYGEDEQLTEGYEKDLWE